MIKSSVDFIIYEKNVTNTEEIMKSLELWSGRKKTMFSNPKFVLLAIDRLERHKLI